MSHAVTPPGSPSPRPGPAPSSSHMGPRFTDGETEARRKPARPSPSAPLEGLPAPMHQANKRLRTRRPQTPTCSPSPAVTKLRVPTAIWDPGPPKPRHRSPRSRPDTGSGMPQVWALRPAAGTLLGSPGAPCRRARAAREPAGRGSRPRHSSPGSPSGDVAVLVASRSRTPGDRPRPCPGQADQVPSQAGGKAPTGVSQGGIPGQAHPQEGAAARPQAEGRSRGHALWWPAASGGHPSLPPGRDTPPRNSLSETRSRRRGASWAAHHQDGR